LKRALEIRPDDPDALRALARVAAAGGAWNDSAQASRELLRQTPEDSATRLTLARSEAALHQLTSAHADATRVTEIDPGNADAWLLRGALAIDLRKPDDARRALERAQALAGEGRAPVEFAWALLERLEGNPTAAEMRLKALLRRHPAFSPAARLLLETARAEGRGAEAEAYLRSLRRPP
jgi:Flp pilus assembly protein TadD